MKKIRNKILIIIVLVTFFQIIGSTNSKYIKTIIKEGKGQIAEPIIILESFEEKSENVSKLDFPKEYEFKIKNYNNQKINEVDFLYEIEIISSTNNFPIEYKLIDLNENKQINLSENKSEYLKLKKSEKEEKNYKLVVEWKDKKIEYLENIKLKIKVNLKQYKIGEI